MFQKTNISYPLIRTCPCVCFPENFAYLLNECSQAERGREKSYFELIIYCITSQNAQAHFKNLATFTART